uniref:AMP-binding domain-containing protein n=1 Tax=Macrostomum lignano TaxID=282301 RepID=A0A1I8FBZ2_9PLAT
ESLSRLKRRPLLTSPTASSVGTARGFESLPVLGAQSSLIRRTAPAVCLAHFDEALQRHAGEGSGKSLAITCMEADGRLAYYLLNKVGHKGSSRFETRRSGCSAVAASDVCTLGHRLCRPVSWLVWCLCLLNRRLLPLLRPARCWLLWRTGDRPSLDSRASSSRWPMLNAAQPETASARAVCISRVALLSHGKALCSALGYGKGDTAVCLLDPRRDVGLWHGLVASMLAGLHVYFVPYSLMKSDSLAWLRLVAKQRVGGLAWAKSRDLYWSLLAGKDESSTSGMSLASLRCLLVADSINPWSLTSCDSFLTCFRSRGLSPNCLVTCAYSPESLTVSLRRPGYSVDCGHLPAPVGCRGGPSRPSGRHGVRPQLCRVDEVGEICVCSRYSAARYAGNDSRMNGVFNCRPVSATGDEIDSAGSGTDGAFVRTAIDRLSGPAYFGKRVALVVLEACYSFAAQLPPNYCVAKRRHSAEDIIATVLAVEPLKFVYRGRIAVFAQPLLGDDRIVVVAEQRPDAQRLALLTPGPVTCCRRWRAFTSCQFTAWPSSRPTRCPAVRTARWKPSLFETCTRPADSDPVACLMCPQAAVADQLHRSNLSSVGVGPEFDKFQQRRADAALPDADRRPSMASQQRAGHSTVVGLHRRFVRIRHRRRLIRRHRRHCCQLLSWRAAHSSGPAQTSDRVASLIRTGLQLTALNNRRWCLPLWLWQRAPGPDLLAGLFGAMLAGCVPALVGFSAFARLVRAADCVGVVSSQPVAKLLKPNLRPPLPPLLELDKGKKSGRESRRLGQRRPQLKAGSQTDPESAAYLDLCGAGSPQDDSLQTPGSSAPIGVRVTHRAAMAACQCLQTRCDLQLGRDLPACVDLYSGGMAFIVACLASVACGHSHPAHASRRLVIGAQRFWRCPDSCRCWRSGLCVTPCAAMNCWTGAAPGCNLSCQGAKAQPGQPPVPHRAGHGPAEGGAAREVRRLLVPLGLSPTALRCSFGCRVNPCLTLPATDVDADSAAIYADARALRQDRLVSTRDSPNAVALLQAGQPAPDARISLATPSVRGGDVGEILVRSRGNVEPLTAATAAAGLSARTGYLGVIRQVDSGPAPALFVIGAVADCLTGLAVFACDSLLAVVMELSCRESDALDAVPQATTALLRDHQLVASVLIVCDPGAIPANGRGAW